MALEVAFVISDAEVNWRLGSWGMADVNPAGEADCVELLDTSGWDQRPERHLHSSSHLGSRCGFVRLPPMRGGALSDLLGPKGALSP